MGKIEVDQPPCDRQRPADVVADRTLEWLEKNQAGPFFCWAHFYDPHGPLEPPADFRKKFEKPYDAEIAFMDSQIKRLLDWLEAKKLTDRTTIMVVGDHGEGFGDHGEIGHGIFVYQETMLVPLIIVSPGITSPSRVPTLVEVADIFLTALELFGLPSPDGLSSRSLLPALAGKSMDDQECYSESHMMFNSHGFAEQRALTTRKWKYISSARPELYDLEKDNGEFRNLVDSEPAVAKTMLTKLLDRYESWSAGKPTTLKSHEESRQALEALGYASSGSRLSTEFLTPGAADPKDMLPAIHQCQKAQILMGQGKHDEALPLFEAARAVSPKSFMLNYSLGSTYLHLERFDEAIKAFDTAIKIDTDFVPVWLGMGDAYIKKGSAEEALKHYHVALGLEGENPVVHYKLSQALAKLGRTADAVERLRKAVSIKPDYGAALYDLAFTLGEQGATTEAVKYYRDAAKARPEDAPTRYNLGIMLIKTNQLSDASEQLREAVRLKPDYGDALVNLGISLGLQNRMEEARKAFDAAAAIPASAAEAYFNLGVTLAKAGDSDDAIAAYEKALEVQPGHERAIESLFRVQIQKRATGQAVLILRKAVEMSPDNFKFHNMLAEVLATTPNDDVRDGASALRVIRTACEKTDYRVPGLLGTLAAAYAETGDFNKAVETARRAIDLAAAANQPKVADRITAQLDQYLQNKPYRNTKY
jgi:tetratricopeptide (TPR) repeat protein